VIAPPPHLRVLAKRKQALRDGVDHANGYFCAAAGADDVEPDIVKFGFGGWKEMIAHLQRAFFFGGEPGETSPFNVFREVGGLFQRRNSPAFASGVRSLSLVNGSEDLGAAAFAPFPQIHSVLQRVFLALIAAALNRLANKGFLVVG
jgi:hypothetical protein